MCIYKRIENFHLTLKSFTSIKFQVSRGALGKEFLSLCFCFCSGGCRSLATEKLSESALFVRCCLAVPPLGPHISRGDAVLADHLHSHLENCWPPLLPSKWLLCYGRRFFFPGKKNLLLDRNSSSTFPPSKTMADVMGSDDQIGKFHFHRINSASYFKNYCLTYANVERTNRAYWGRAIGNCSALFRGEGCYLLFI